MSIGSIFDSTAEVLVNPVNCQGVLGAGLAKQFKLRFPAWARQMELGTSSIGVGQVCWIQSKPVIACLPTKILWRDKSHIRYIEAGLLALRPGMQTHGYVSVAMPKIGCGLGGLDWRDVKPLVETILVDRGIQVEYV